MKMKAVCEVTGLTGWNVRNYIRGKLIDPAYTETYLGRKHYDFSERDISRLRQIVILRKGGFSVEQIEEMFRDPGAVRKNVEELREGGMLNGGTVCGYGPGAGRLPADFHCGNSASPGRRSVGSGRDRWRRR